MDAPPRDDGPAGTIGFVATVDGKPVPRYLIPMRRRRGGRGTDAPPRPRPRAGREVRLASAPSTARGTSGPAAEVAAKSPPAARGPCPAGSAPKPPEAKGTIPKLRGAEVAIIDELDKVHPVRGTLDPRAARRLSRGQSPLERPRERIRLHAARNEFVAFQVVVRDGAARRRAVADLRRGRRSEHPRRVRPLSARPGDERARCPTRSSRSATAPPSVPGRTSQSLHAEVYVPHDAPAGRPCRDPDAQVGRPDARDRRHAPGLGLHPPRPPQLPPRDELLRPAAPTSATTTGSPTSTGRSSTACPTTTAATSPTASRRSGTARRSTGTAWDRRFGPLLDGSAFADLPAQGRARSNASICRCTRTGRPRSRATTTASYWADRAFTPSVSPRPSSRSSRQFAEHANAQGLERHVLPVLLQRQGRLQAQRLVARDVPLAARRAGELPGLLGPPLLRPGLPRGRRAGPRPGQARLPLRHLPPRVAARRRSTACSTTTSSAAPSGRYRRIVLDRKEAEGQVVVEYGSTNAIEESNMQPVGWSLDAWSLGLDGVLPWQTIGDAESWTKADALSLFYPRPPTATRARSPRSASRRSAAASRTSST